MSGCEVGRPHLSGSHRIELLNAKPEMLILLGFNPAGRLFSSPPGIDEAAAAVPSDESFLYHPTTFDDLQMGPSTSTFFVFWPIVATGHVPNTLHIVKFIQFRIKQYLSCVSYLKLIQCVIIMWSIGLMYKIDRTNKRSISNLHVWFAYNIKKKKKVYNNFFLYLYWAIALNKLSIIANELIHSENQLTRTVMDRLINRSVTVMSGI